MSTTADVISRRAGRERAPLSFAQQRLWFFDRLMPGSALYNISFAARLRFAVDPRVMKSAVEEIVRRHEVLRSTIDSDGEEPAQVIHATIDVPLSAIDLRRIPPERRDAEAASIVGRFQAQPFDLGAGPLVRVMLLWLAPADFLLVVGVHHIVADGWSLGVFSQELGVLYQAYATGRPPSLPELELQYGDFAAWQRDRLTGAVLDEQLSYWRTQLADLSVLELPVDLPRPPVQAHRGGDVAFSVPGPLLERLGVLARGRRATLFMVLLAGFDAVMARWCGQDDVVLGVPVANRTRAEIEGLIGFFVNTLPLRVDVSGNPTFNELIGRVRETAVDGYAHQDLPFEKLVEELHQPRDLSRNPLVQVIFQLFESASDPGAVILQAGMELPSRTSLFDLRVDLVPDGAGLAGRVEYDVDLFERVTMEHLATRYVRLLEQAVEHPGLPISSYEFVAPDEHRVLAEWNATSTGQVPGVPVHELFGRVAGRVPDGVALVVGGERVCFGELEGLAGRLAAWLVGVGVGRGDVVGVCVPRGVWLVAAMLGVWKVGGVVLVLEPDVPVGRLGFMAEDAGVVAVVTTVGCRGVAPSCGVVVVVDGEWPVGLVEVPPVVGVGLGDGAWVLYTSGSSGMPKGVLGSHGGLVNRLWWGWRVAPFGVEEVALAKTRAGFVDAVWEVFGPLVAGVPVVVVDEVTAGDPVGLAEVVVREGVTRLVGVPSLLSVLFEVAGERLGGSRLVEVTASGEVVSGELVRRIRSVLPGCRVVNLYGSTEVAGDATGFVVPAGWVGERVPIGRPLDNVWVQVVGPSGEVVPVGVVGELVVGGAAVAMGYVGWAAGETGERFVADRWSGSDARVYRTGDLGRWRADGLLEFVGRVDGQVKVRGVRVEPGEVEAVLVAHPNVVEAAVVARVGAGGGVELVGFVVLAEAGAGVDAVRGWLRSRLVEQMVPAHLVVVAVLPKLANGKLDRDALVGRDEVGVSAHAYEPPSGPDEEAVGAVFAELTGAARVGRHDDFFADLGGHSLLATRAVSRLRVPFRRDIPLRLLFEHPTIATLTPAINTLTDPHDPSPTTITPLDRHHYRTSRDALTDE